MPRYSIKVKGKIDRKEFEDLKKEGIDIEKLIKEIEERIKGFESLEYEVIVFADQGNYRFILKAPPVSELVKKIINVQKLTDKEDKGKIMGDIKIEDIKRIAEIKRDELLGKDENARIKQIIGAISSYRITIEGKEPKEVMTEFGN